MLRWPQSRHLKLAAWPEVSCSGLRRGRAGRSEWPYGAPALMANARRAGCSAASSAGLAPLRMRATYQAERRSAYVDAITHQATGTQIVEREVHAWQTVSQFEFDNHLALPVDDRATNHVDGLRRGALHRL